MPYANHTLAVELGDMAKSVRLPLIQASGSSYELVETEPPVFSTSADIIQLQLSEAATADSKSAFSAGSGILFNKFST